MLLALLAAAAALRPQLSGVGPLLNPIRHDLGMSDSVAGLLATIPVACMGLFAYTSARLTTRFGGYRVMTSALAAIAVAGLVRAIVPGAGPVLALTVAFGLGAGVAGTLLPAIVKSDFASGATRITALYSVSLNGAAALAAGVAVPISNAAGGWRGALAWFGAWDVLLALVWTVAARGGAWGSRTGVDRSAARRPVGGRESSNRPGRAWVLGLAFGLQATVYYGLNAWLASAFREHGWSSADAGALVAVLNFSTLPATLAVAAFAGRIGNRAVVLAISSVTLLLATLGIVLLPAAGVAWAALDGLALGTIFPLCMAAIVDFGRDAQEVTHATGLMLGGGYLIAAAGPVVLGALRDATGSFTVGVGMLAGVSLALVGVCTAMVRSPGPAAGASAPSD